MALYYMSIGYPIGICEDFDGVRNYAVELNNKNVYLNNIESFIWNICFFDIKDIDVILDNGKNKNISKQEIEKAIESLSKNKLLIILNDLKLDYIYNKLKKLTVLRNGFGLGVINKESAAILNQNQKMEISLYEFNVWANSNNRITIQEINKIYIQNEFLKNETSKHYIINIILKLKTLDLIRLNIYE